MKKSLFLVSLLLMSVAAMAQGGNGITLKMENKAVSVVLNEITKQAGYSFVIPTNEVDVKRKVNIQVDNQPIEAVLDLVFEGMDVAWRIDGKKVYVERETEKEAEGGSSSKLVRVQGIVSDEQGEPIIGATVMNRASQTGTTTDFDGNFSLEVPAGVTLEVSYLGYTTAEVKAEDGKPLVVRMYEDTQKLDELVVVGYGVQRKSDLTGSITSVTAEDLNSTPTNNMAEMLRGKAAGVQVQLSNAKPGGSSDIIIRGRRSLSGGNNPLYIVDGVPMESIDEINTSDIASMEVLKDAAAQSIYGARASNGVLLITTKRGVEGKPKVDYNFYVGRQHIYRNFEFYNGEEWAEYRREAWRNAFGAENYDETACFSQTMRDVIASGEYVNWEELMIRPALQQKHDITVRSGNEKSKMAFSLGYYGQTGMVMNSGYDRITGRLNLDHQILKTLSLGANIYYSHSNTESADGTFTRFISMPPVAKVYDEEGNLRMDVTDVGENHYNPLWNVERSKNDLKSDNFLTNLYVDWEIIPGLTYRANGSMTYRNELYGNYLYRDHTTGRDTNGSATLRTKLRKEFLLENILNYNKEFDQHKHRLGVTLMQSLNTMKLTTDEQTGMGFPNDDKGYDAISSAVEHGTPVHNISERRLISYMGRVNYTLLDRYMLSAAVRIDGSSVFGRNNKYGYFPSVSAAWRLSEEEFMRADWLSNLKLRASWGQVGNQAIDPYATLGLTQPYLNEFGNGNVQAGFLPGEELPNPDLKWETTSSANLGLDFGFFQERLSGTLEVYKMNTTDLLVKRNISQSLGYTSQLMNLGEVENKGVEFSIVGTPVRTNHVTWSLNYSISANRNKILKITGEVDENGKPLDDLNSNWFIGHPMSVYYNYKFDGIWQTEDADIIPDSHMPDAQPGMIRVADTDGSGYIDADDKVIMERDPKWISSFGTTLNVYGFDFAMDFYVRYGGIFNNSYLSSWESGGDMSGKRNGIKRDYWTPENPSNTAPAPNYLQAPAYITTCGYTDASYIRLRNVTLGYTLPKNISRKFFVEKLRIYASGTNLWTKTKIQSYNPETNTGGYPEPRTFLLGMNLSF